MNVHLPEPEPERVRDELAAALARVAELEALEASARRREKVQAALYRIAETASSAQDMQAFYAAIHGIVAELMYGENFYIALYDEEREMINFPYYSDAVDLDVPDPNMWEPFGIGNASGATAYVLRTGEPQYIPRARHEALVASGEIALVGAEGEDWLGVPLRSEGRTLGALVIQTYELGQKYTEDDVRILTFVGQHVATALTRVRAIDEVRQRNSELAVVNEIGLALAQQLDFDAIVELVGERIRDIFRARSISIGLLDRTAGLIRWPFEIEEGERIRSEPMPLGAGLTAIVVQTGRPVVTRTLEESEARGAIFLGSVKHESFLGVPIPAGNDVIGVIDLESIERHAFDDADARLLSTLASSAGVALENARLFDETKRLLAETDERAAELGIINGVQQGLAAQLDMQVMYDLVGDRIQEIFDAQVVDIGIVDRDAQLIRFPYTIERGVRFPDEPIPIMGMRKYVIDTRAPLLINERATERAIELGQPGAIQGEPAKSTLWAPLIAGDEVRGVISLQNLDREQAFDEGDVRLLTTIAASLSVALENARLIHETRQRNAELAVVNSVGQAVSAQLDLEVLIDLVGERMREMFDADIVYVALHDVTTNLIEFPYYSEAGRREANDPIAFGEGLTSRILRGRKPLLLNHAAQFDELGTRGTGTLAKSYLGMPIMVGEDAIGVISVQSTSEEGRFGEADAALLATLAASVGVAIQNARLFRARRDAEEEYRRLVEELPLVVYKDKPDETATSVYISPQVEQMFGYPREAWLDEAFFASVLHPDDRERVTKTLGAGFAGTDKAVSDEYRVIAADGRTVWVRDDAWIVRDDAGDPLFQQGFMIDTTEQTLAAAEIRRQKQYFESLVEISPVAVVIIDRDETVSGWNPAATRLFGYEPDEAVGRHIDDLLFTADTRGEGRETTRLATETGRAHLIAHRRRKDGELVDVEIVLVPLTVDGEHTGYYAIYHDITELQAARREADAANEAKSTFLASMSHEIRTPMNAIIGMSGLLVETQLDAEQRDYAETIRTSGESLLTIINDILDFSKIEAGRIELEALPFALGPCVEGALDVVAPAAAAKRVELAYAIDGDLPHVLVGDAGRLRQIVLNLLSNAVKFTERGEIVVSVGGRRAGGQRRSGSWEISIEVRDTGIGIPSDRMDRLFQSFSQADASISRRYGGTGLGLVISRRLAELMDGSITAESSGVPGEGSHFRLAFNATEAPDAAVSQPAPIPTTALTGKRALVVDDSATNRRILVALLRRWGMVAHETASPQEALDWIREGKSFDVALVDQVMPDVDGLALAASIREATTGPPLPVIIVSSQGQRSRNDPGVAATLTKPIKPSPLLDAIQTVIAGSTMVEAARPDRPVLHGDLGASHPLRVLLAEDNVVNQKLALRLLAQMGYTADLAENGLEAIAAVDRTPYDIVLMDVQMPELDGLEATRRIRARGLGNGPRIVAMTANAMAGDREACLAAGMDDYVSKPIRVDALAAALTAAPRREIEVAGD